MPGKTAQKLKLVRGKAMLVKVEFHYSVGGGYIYMRGRFWESFGIVTVVAFIFLSSQRLNYDSF